MVTKNGAAVALGVLLVLRRVHKGSQSHHGDDDLELCGIPRSLSRG